MTLLLSALGLHKSYVAGLGRCWARVTVLSSLSLSLAEGERVLIRGAAASGKTTLLQCLLGLRRVDAGSVRWNAGRGAPYRVCLEPGDVAAATATRAALVELSSEDERFADWQHALRSCRRRGAGWLVLATEPGALAAVAHRTLELRGGSLRALTGQVPPLRVAEPTRDAQPWRGGALRPVPTIRD